jgi:hypothetical protein
VICAETLSVTGVILVPYHKDSFLISPAIPRIQVTTAKQSDSGRKKVKEAK